jgi:hypothetical protein
MNSVADPGCLSRIRLFSIPDPGSTKKNLSIFTQKIVSKLLGNMIQVVHPGSGSGFLYLSQIPGSKRHRIPDPGSATLWLNILLPRRQRQRRQSRRANVSSSGDCCWRRSDCSPAAHPGHQPILTIPNRKIVNVKKRNDSLCHAVLSFASVLKLNYPKDHVV